MVLLRSFDVASGKILRLAEAIPEANHGRRPMDGVSTVRDVLVHVTETSPQLSLHFPPNFTGRPGRAAVSCPSRITGTPLTTTSEKPTA